MSKNDGATEATGTTNILATYHSSDQRAFCPRSSITISVTSSFSILSDVEIHSTSRNVRNVVHNLCS